MNNITELIDFELSVLLEETSLENIESLRSEVKDTKWYPELSTDSNYYSFKFNVEGEESCGTAENPCYNVTMSKTNSSWYLAFSRADSNYGDAPTTGGEQFQSAGGMAGRRPESNPRFAGILYAFGKFIKEKSPEILSWSATSTMRMKVYRTWMTINLFPDHYIGFEEKWIRSDIYKRDFIPKGYPQIPEGIKQDSSPLEKRVAVKTMGEEYKKNQLDIAQTEREAREAEERRRREEEDRRREAERQANERRLQSDLKNSEFNPNSLTVGDNVYAINESYFIYTNYSRNRENSDGSVSNRKVGKITQINYLKNLYPNNPTDENPLVAKVNFPSAENAMMDNFSSASQYAIKLNDLRKETDAEKTSRLERYNSTIETLINDRSRNPNGIKKGDRIVTRYDNLNHPDNGQIGTVEEFFIRQIPYSNNFELRARVDWEPESKEYFRRNYPNSDTNIVMTMRFLQKATPENIEQLRRDQRNADIEQQISRTRRRAERSRQNVSQETDPSLLNHPANPDQVKIGDRIEVINGEREYSLRYMRGGIRTNFKGTLLGLTPSYDPNILRAKIKFDNTTRSILFYAYAPSENRPYIKKDTSERAQRSTQRRQRQQTQSELLRTGTRGFQIGDTVTVTSGRNRGKSGRITNFRVTGQNIIAVIMPIEGTGQFTSNVNMLQSPQPATENITFKNYVWLWENDCC